MAAKKRIVVIGGGPAGIQAALAASSSGQNVTLVTDGLPGGRAAWQTLLPSKMWLNARPGGTSGPVCLPGEIAEMHARYDRVAGAWQRQLMNEIERSGAELLLGTASFLSPHEIQVLRPEGGYPDQIRADCVIIAAGAVPFVPPNLQPDGERVFSPHMIWQMKKMPESMIVVGAGGPATEYVDAFSRLGVRITWVTGPVGVLSAFPPDAGNFIAGVMQRRGVRIITGLMARQLDRLPGGVHLTTADGAVHEAEMAFVAIGLRPDLERLNLAAAGLKVGSSSGLATDPFFRTTQEHIYLVGDAASPLSANISMAQGRLAGWHAAGLSVEPLRLEYAVMAIYTEPQVAVVGRLSDRDQQLQKIHVPFSTCLRAHLLTQPVDPDEMGFLDIAFDGDRHITGALAVCPEAAEVLTPLAVAVATGMTLDALASVYPAHPTFSELPILAARMVK